MYLQEPAGICWNMQESAAGKNHTMWLEKSCCFWNFFYPQCNAATQSTHTHTPITRRIIYHSRQFSSECQPTVLLLHHSHHHQNNFWEMELYSIRHQTFQLELDWTRSRGAFEVVDVPVRNSRGLYVEWGFYPRYFNYFSSPLQEIFDEKVILICYKLGSDYLWY